MCGFAICHQPTSQLRPLLREYLIPRFALKDLPVMAGLSLLGALIAGLYGIAHDQITYSISPEYFTNFKFKQFHWANLRLGDRTFVSCIGFLATWWVGLIIAWILVRRLLPGQQQKVACQNVLKGFFVVFSTVLLFGVGGFLYGTLRGPDADYSNWSWAFEDYQISDQWAFVRVAYVHNAGYLGGLVGLILTFFFIKPIGTQDTA